MLPALNPATTFAGILIVSLVNGLIPSLAALSLAVKVPNPTNATFPSFLRPSVIPSIVASYALKASALVNPAFAATNSTNSVLLIVNYLPFTSCIFQYDAYILILA